MHAYILVEISVSDSHSLNRDLFCYKNSLKEPKKSDCSIVFFGAWLIIIYTEYLDDNMKDGMIIVF